MYKIFNNSAEIISKFNICKTFCEASGLCMYCFSDRGEPIFSIYSSEILGLLPERLPGLFEELLSKEYNGLPVFICTPIFGSYFRVDCPDGSKAAVGPSLFARPDESAVSEGVSRYANSLAVKKEMTEFYAHAALMDYKAFANNAVMLDFMLNGTAPDFEKLMASGNVIPLPDGSLSSDTLIAEEYIERIPFELIKNIVSAVKSGSINELSHILKDITSWNAGYSGDSPLRTAKNTFIALTAIICREANASGIDRGLCFALGEYYTNYAEAQSAVDGLLSVFVKLLYDLAGRIGRLDNESTSELTSAVKKYIRAHIGETITVADISAGINFSVPYICRKFKLDTGKTVNTYIHETKILEAQRFIRLKRLPLSELWLHFGYSDQSHFNRVFKSVTGMTPGGYSLLCAEERL